MLQDIYKVLEFKGGVFSQKLEISDSPSLQLQLVKKIITTQIINILIPTVTLTTLNPFLPNPNSNCQGP